MTSKDPRILFGDEVCTVLPRLREFLKKHDVGESMLDARLSEMSFQSPRSCDADTSDEAVRIIFLKELKPRLSHIGRLARGFGLMSNEQLQALLIVEGCGCSYNEAAKACDCPIGTIKSRLNRARAFLKSVPSS